ncbi:MAG: helix-turn-helix transcriptional regulator [Eubacteriales bacterium]|nr:helix-turn-helix transcriptional regulator [Eubacteriales bacterium]
MDQSYEERFAERLTGLRMNKGVSAREMSLALGQSVNYINHIENKKVLPSMVAFFNICDYLDITPQEFFAFDNPAPQCYNEILTDLKKLSELERSSLQTIIQSMANK